MSRANLFLATACVITALSLGCSGNKMSVSDAQIATDIQSKLYSDAATRQSGVSVTVKDGAVTLSGDVPNSDVELAAMKIANSATGVHGVADQMKVNVAAVPASPKITETPAPVVKTPSQLSPPSTNTISSVSNSSLPSTNSTDGRTTFSSVETTAPRRAVPERVTIASGERLSVRTVDAIDSSKVTEGQALRASLEAPLVSKGQVIVPAGAPITLQVSSVKSAGRIKGNSELSLRATSLEYRGRNYPITTSEYSDTGKGRGKNTALKTGIGAAAGALIGGLAGGGKGAAIGAGAGGGAGFGYNALTHGQQVKIPSETVLNFQLQSPLTVPASR